MSQPAFFIALHLLGVAFQLAFGPRRQPGLCCALGFLTGLAVWVLGALALVVSPVPYTAGSALAVYALATAVVVVPLARSWRPARAELAAIGVWTLAFAAAVLLLCSFDASRFSPDSRNIVTASHILAAREGEDLFYFSRKGAFQVIAHSAAWFAPEDYFYALSSVTGLSLAPVFVLLGWRGLALLGADGWRNRALVVAAAAATVTTYMYSYHLFYIHTNIGAAAYLLAFAALFWIAEHERDGAHVPALFLFLVAYALHRLEGAVFAALLLLIAVFPSHLPRRALTWGVAAYAAMIAPWYARLMSLPPNHLTRGRALAVVICTLALFGGWLVTTRTRLERLRRFAPAAVLVGLLALIAAGFVLRPDNMSRSIEAMYENLLSQKYGMWGYAWHAVILLAVLAAFAPSPRHATILSYTALSTVLLTLVIAIPHPYRIARNDSANRMMIQVLPVAFFYFSMKFLPLFGPATRETATAPQPEASCTEGSGART